MVFTIFPTSQAFKRFISVVTVGTVPTLSEAERHSRFVGTVANVRHWTATVAQRTVVVDEVIGFLERTGDGQGRLSH